jgi:regulator of replication initiation timing
MEHELRDLNKNLLRSFVDIDALITENKKLLWRNSQLREQLGRLADTVHQLVFPISSPTNKPQPDHQSDQMNASSWTPKNVDIVDNVSELHCILVRMEVLQKLIVSMHASIDRMVRYELEARNALISMQNKELEELLAKQVAKFVNVLS